MKSQTQFILFVLFIFFHGAIPAQLDTVLINKTKFVFEIPLNWQIDQEKQKEIDFNNWELILSLSHKINGLKATIYSGIIDNEQLKSFLLKKEKNQGDKKSFITDALKINERIGKSILISDYPSPRNFPREVENLFIYKLDTVQSLILGFFAVGQPLITDSLKKSYFAFCSDFMGLNGRSIDLMRPMAFHHSTSITDSFPCAKKYFIFSYPSDWNESREVLATPSNSNSGSVLLAHNSEKDSVLISVTATAIIIVNPKLSLPPIQNKGETPKQKTITAPPPLPLYPKGLSTDTLENYIFNFSNKTTSKFPDQKRYGGTIKSPSSTIIEYYIKAIDNMGSEFILEFKLSFEASPKTDKYYYLELLRSYALLFMKENNLRQKM